jgi:hypothetical protein
MLDRDALLPRVSDVHSEITCDNNYHDDHADDVKNIQDILP